jgi:4-amino-4-deoxy-L-arabinose transferase-like glycosyltransferase
MTGEERPSLAKRLVDIGRGNVFGRAAAVALGIVALGWCVMRFVGLAQVPYGRSTDETLAALHVECLAQTGASADGHRWPLFATGIGGGLYTPTYLYTLFAWTRVFGASITSIRALSATFSIAAIVGIWLLVRKVADERAAWLAAAAAALSPWSFQVARLATDAPMAPMLLVFAVYFFVRSPRARWAAAAGVFMSLAAYTYPPVRLQAALLVALLLFVERARLDGARVGAFLGAMAVTALPLLVLTLNGTLMGRSKALSILSIDYIDANRGQSGRVLFVVKQALENLFEHLRPSYLFFSGDSNIRHSTQIIGELGWLDVLALALFLGASVVALMRVSSVRGHSVEVPPSRGWLVAGCAILAGAFATLPAALCWEGLPHAFRSMGAWPAVAVFTGVVLSVAWSRWPFVRALPVALALAQTAYFVPYYFDVYPFKSYEAWSGDLRDAAESRDLRRFATVARGYPDLGYRYYLMHRFAETCVSSRDEATKIGAGGF